MMGELYLKTKAPEVMTHTAIRHTGKRDSGQWVLCGWGYLDGARSWSSSSNGTAGTKVIFAMKGSGSVSTTASKRSPAPRHSAVWSYFLQHACPENTWWIVMTRSNYVISSTFWWTQFAITEGSRTSVNASITDLEKQYFIMLSQIYMIVPIARFYFAWLKKLKYS